MSYIYDILANFHSSFFDFFEWNYDDDIVHIKKLPILRVSVDFFYCLKFSSVVVSSDLLDKIYRKTDFFKLNKDKYCYVCCFSDGREALIVRFSKDGSVLGRSSMLLDEEGEAVSLSECVDICNYDFVSVEKCDFLGFKTRKEVSEFFRFSDKLKSMDDNKLFYLYFECFNEYEDDRGIVLSKIMSVLDENFASIGDKVGNFLKLTSFNK